MDLRDVLTAILFGGFVFLLLRLRTWSVRQQVRQERLSRPPRLEIDFELHYRPRRRALVFEHAGTVPVQDVEIWLGTDRDRPADHVETWFEPGEVLEVPFDPDRHGVRLVREQVRDTTDTYLDLQVELRSRRESGVTERDTWPRAYVD
jgi:hypothetical protein